MDPGFTPPPPVLSPSTPPPHDPRTEKKVVWIVVAAVLAVLLLVVLFVGAVFAAILGGIRSSDPYRFAMQTATHDPGVLSRLGSPVQAGWLVGGNINVQSNSGAADLTIPVQGSVRQGTLHVVARKSEGEWTYQRLTLRVNDSPERLDLLAPAGAVPKER